MGTWGKINGKTAERIGVNRHRSLFNKALCIPFDGQGNAEIKKPPEKEALGN